MATEYEQIMKGEPVCDGCKCKKCNDKKHKVVFCTEIDKNENLGGK